MGTRMVPSYANLFMGKFEQQAIDNSSLKPFIWWRFIDDIFMIWTHREEHLKTFIGYLILFTLALNSPMSIPVLCTRHCLDAIIRVRMLLCETSVLLFVTVCCYAKPRYYYSCPYAVMRNLDTIIRVRMLLCETSMLLLVTVCCYAKPRCYYSCPYAVMRNLDAIIRVSNYVRLNPGLPRQTWILMARNQFLIVLKLYIT